MLRIITAIVIVILIVYMLLYGFSMMPVLGIVAVAALYMGMNYFAPQYSAYSPRMGSSPTFIPEQMRM